MHIEHLALALLLALQVGMLLVWRQNVFDGWWKARTVQLVIYASIAVIQGGALWIRGGSFLRED